MTIKWLCPNGKWIIISQVEIDANGDYYFTGEYGINPILIKYRVKNDNYTYGCYEGQEKDMLPIETIQYIVNHFDSHRKHIIESFEEYNKVEFTECGSMD